MNLNNKHKVPVNTKRVPAISDIVSVHTNNVLVNVKNVPVNSDIVLISSENVPVSQTMS